MKINVSIDDISIHPQSRIEPIIERCEYLLNWFPDMKFTFFMPIAYWRRFGPTATKKPLWIQQEEKFLDKLMSLPPEYFEIGIHGIFHSSENSNNNEMLGLTDEIGAMSYINTIYDYFRTYEIDFSNVVRPCGWAIAPEAAKAFNKFFDGDFTLSLHKDYCPNELLDVIKENSIDVVWCDSCPPFLPLVKKPDLEIVYHACEWDKNYLSQKKAAELRDFLFEELDKYESLEFAFIRDIKNG